jgi:predicted RNase H-like nuclease
MRLVRNPSERRLLDQEAAAPHGVFVGVDLAWDVDHRHSGIAVMEGGRAGVRLTRIAPPVHSLAGVMQVIREHLGGLALIAVDASLIVPNETGQRPCERAVGRVFGRQGASCHSSNRGRPHFDSGERLVRALMPHGFAHGSPWPKGPRGRWVIEVYPHPAMVRLFGLARIIPYKKGTVMQRRAGLAVLQGHLERLVGWHSGLVSSPCLARLLAEDPGARAGQALKQLEDQLDAVLCAYLAWHVWRWGEARNEVYGDTRTGYIVVPKTAATLQGGPAQAGHGPGKARPAHRLD